MATNSDNRNYSRINRALMNTLRKNRWEAYNNGEGGVNIVTDKAASRISQAVTRQGRLNAIQRAVNGGSAG